MLSYAGPPTAGVALAIRILSQNRDILDQRVVCGARNPPPWLVADRNTREWLLSLSSAELHACERKGVRATHQTGQLSATPPRRLLELTESVDELRSFFPTNWASSSLTDANGPGAAKHGAKLPNRVNPSKFAQIQAVGDAVVQLLGYSNTPEEARIRRVVDIGGGHAHLARHLVREVPLRLPEVQCPPIACVDRDLDLLTTAEQLCADKGINGSQIRFLHSDVCQRFEAEDGDMLVGLHACGELGDCIVRSAADPVSGAVSALVLVSCCFHRAFKPLETLGRSPLSNAGKRRTHSGETALWIPRPLLGLANRTHGYGTPAVLTARETRIALRTFLEQRGHSVAPGNEVHGISRHRLRRGLDAVAADAASSRGDHRPVSPHELLLSKNRAKVEYQESKSRMSDARSALATATSTTPYVSSGYLNAMP